jgi:2-haloacid dehalogenase
VSERAHILVNKKSNVKNKGEKDNMKKYDVILLDVDNTLLDFTKSMQAALKETLEKFGVIYTDKIYARYNEINDNGWLRFERGEIEKGRMLIERFETLFAEIGLHIDCSTINDEYLTALSRYAFVLPGAKELCEALALNHKLYIVTNGTKIAQNGRLADSDLLQYMSGVFISEEIGFQKPQKQFFDYVFNAIENTNTERMIILGDSLSSDIQGGINAGIATCWYNPNGSNGGEKCDYVIKTLEEFLEVVK